MGGSGEEPNSEMVIEDTSVGGQQSVEQKVLNEGEKPLGVFTEATENPISEENDNLEQILPERNSAKTLGNEKKDEVPNYDVWMAQTMLNGWDGQGMAWYPMFNAWTDPVYRELGGYISDDMPLLVLSAAWSVAFNSEYRKEFANESKYIYEVILMEYLKYDSENKDGASIELENNEMKFAMQLYSAVTSDITDKASEYISDLSIEEASNLLKNAEIVDNMNFVVKDIIEPFAKNAIELIDMTAEYLALQQVKEEKVALLKKARDTCAASNAPNSDFIKAADELIDVLQRSELEYVGGKTLDMLWSKTVDQVWGVVCEMAPFLGTIELGVSGLNVCFDTTNTASNDLKLRLLYNVDYYLRQGMLSAEADFKGDSTADNGRTFLSCFQAYVQFQMYGNTFANTWIGDYIDSGYVANAINIIFHRENLKTAEDLIEHIDSQNTTRKGVLREIKRYSNIYENKYKNPELDDLHDTIPVTRVNFINPEFKMKNDGKQYYIARAYVEPSNATNKNITYISSDPNILDVPEDGGMATVRGIGVVAVTATSEDGGFTATQTVTIESDYYVPVTRIEFSSSEVSLEKDDVFTVSANVVPSDATNQNITYTCSDISILDVPKKGGVATIKGTGVVTITATSEDGQFTATQTVTIVDSVPIIDSGSCGDNIQWKLFSDGTLRFYGEGKMSDFETSPWGSGRSDITKIVFSDAITHIGNYAFSSCWNIRSISLPDGLTSIGDGAFSGCSSMGSISLPSGLTSIGDSAFSRCSSISSISLPNGLTSIGESVFSGCSNLSSINLPSGLTSIGDSAFSGCSSISSISLPNGLTNIGKYAFNGCSGLITVNIMEGTSDVEIETSGSGIEERAFYGCTNLSRVSLPNGLTSVGEYAFGYCSNIRSIDLPSGLTSIRGGAFSGCSGLITVNIMEGISNVEIKTTGSGIESSAFNGCTNLSKVSLPNGLTSIEDRTFSDFKSIKDISLPSSLTSIGGYAFSGCSGISNISLPNGLTSIGSKAFSGCSGLLTVSIMEGTCNEEIEIPGSGIGDSAFEGCTNLSKVSLPSGLTSIGGGAFNGCSGISSISFPSGLTSIGGGAFSGCSGISSISFPSGLTSIGDWAFSECSGISSSINFPDGLTSIGEDAFYGCSGISSISLSGGLISIGDGAFSGCSGISSSISFPDGLTSIGKSAFYGCSGISSISFPSGLISIGDWAFRGCSSISSISLPSGLTSIGESAFRDCSGLITVSIMESTGNAAIETSGSGIGMAAFYGCKNLSSVSLPNGLTSIGQSAFSGCSNISSISLPSGLISIEGGTEYFYGGAFSGCSSLSSISLPGGLTEIGNEAFKDCSGLITVDIMEGTSNAEIETLGSGIGYRAFYGCKNLSRVSLPNGLTSIGGAFEGCSSLSNINLPSGLTSIGGGTFEYCISLSSINLPDGLTSIGDQAFRECSSLSSINLPDGLTSIGREAFSFCSNLSSINLPNGLTSIGDGAFSDCSSLKSISLPDSLTSIGRYVITNCMSISITIPKSVDNVSDIEDFRNGAAISTIYGYKGSAAQLYADQREIEFVALDDEGVGIGSSKITLSETAGGEVNKKEISVSGNVYLKDGETATDEQWKVVLNSITWKSSDESVIKFKKCVPDDDPIQENNCAKFTIYLEPQSAGTATVAGTLPNGQKASCFVTVTEETDDNKESIALNKSTLSLVVGNNETLTAIVSPATTSQEKVLWSSNDTSIATVTDNGLVRAVSAGTAEIMAKIDGSDCKAICKVTVSNRPSSSGGSGTSVITSVPTDTVTQAPTLTPMPTDTPSVTPTPGGNETPVLTPTPSITPTDVPSITPTESPKTTVIENQDGSKTEITVSTVTNTDGSTVKTTETVNKDTNGKVTRSSVKTTISTSFHGGEPPIEVIVSKDARGRILNASANISSTSSPGKRNVLISGDMVSQIKRIAGTNNVNVSIKNKNGTKTNTIFANIADLQVGKKLNIVEKKTGGIYVLVNAKTYTVARNGNFSATITRKGTYEFISDSKMNALSKKILQTIKAKNTSKTIKKSKTAKMALKNTLDMDNVKSIKYSVSKKSVATVTKKGVIKGKKVGTAVVKAKVTLKNGRTKIVKMKVKIRK